MTPKVLIVSSHKVKCGIASYAEVLRSLLEREFDVAMAGLDLSLLRRQERHVVRAADRHIKSICARFDAYDVVVIQWEPGLLGCRHADMARRFGWLLDAADRLVLAAHTVMPYPEWNLIHLVRLARCQGLAGLGRHVRNAALVRDNYAALRRRARRGNFALVAHTERDRRFFSDVVGVENVFDHPLSHIRADWRVRLGRDTLPARKELQRLFPDKRTFIGVFGFLSEYKGIATALKAMKYLDEGCQLLIYGGVHPETVRQRQAIDPYLQRLLEDLETAPVRPREGGANAASHGTPPVNSLLGKVAFLGTPDDYDFAVAVNAVDVCVFPYLEVGQSGSGPASHAIELGKPTVLTRTPAFMELEKYFPKHFEMIDVGNHVQLAQTITRLVTVPRSKPPLYYNNETLADFYSGLIRRCAGKGVRPLALEVGGVQHERSAPVAAE